MMSYKVKSNSKLVIVPIIFLISYGFMTSNLNWNEENLLVALVVSLIYVIAAIYMAATILINQIEVDDNQIVINHLFSEEKIINFEDIIKVKRHLLRSGGKLYRCYTKQGEFSFTTHQENSRYLIQRLEEMHLV